MVGFGWSGNVAQRAALRRLRGRCEVTQGRVSAVRRELLGHRITLDRVNGGFWQPEIRAEVDQVAAVGLAHEEELLRVADDGRTDSRCFEAGILLDDADCPAVELPELRVAFRDDLLAAGYIEKASDFLEDDPLSVRTGQRQDMLPCESGNQ